MRGQVPNSMNETAPHVTTVVHGIDGCRGGWVRAALALDADASPTGLAFHLHDSFAECLAATDDAIVAVDIPIGLLDRAISGGRPCDRQARQALGRPRSSSVFSPPARPALHATEYREAIRRNGQGLSQEAFRIIPKIREVDEALVPADQARVFEGHPEMAFLRLAGAGIRERKKAPAGRRRRQDLVESALDLAIDVDAERVRLGRGRVAIDDLLDAAVLTLTARHVANGTGTRAGADERDARGLEMAIWY